MPLPSSIVKASSLAKWVRQLLGGISKSGAPSLAVVQGTTIIKELDPDYIFPGRLKKADDKVDVFPFCVIASYFFAAGDQSNVGDSYQLGGEVELEPGEFLTVRITHNGTWDVDTALFYEVNSTEVEFEALTTIPNAAPSTVTWDFANQTIISQNGLSEQWFVIGWRTPDGQLVNRNLLELDGVDRAGTGTYFFMPLLDITTI